MRLFIALLVCMILLGGMGSAVISDLKPTRVNDCIDLVQTDDQANNCTLTYIKLPSGRLTNIQQTMNRLGNGSFNYTYCSANTSGWYQANGKCDYNQSAWNYYFRVNLQGKEYTTTDGIVYLVVFITLLSVSSFMIYLFISLPYDNPRSSDGRVIAISWKKYLKIFIGCMLYVMFIGINFFAWNISEGILEFTELGKFFKFIFTITFALIRPIFFLVIVWSIAQFVKDKKVEEFIERNLSFR